MRVDPIWTIILGAGGLWILGVFGATLSRLLSDECKAWIPCFIKWIIRSAIAVLPEEQRERYKEEWQSHIDEIPGDISKIVTALGFMRAAKRMPSETARNRSEKNFPPVSGNHIIFVDNAFVDEAYADRIFAKAHGTITVTGTVNPRLVKAPPEDQSKPE
jgi:hypothetical protein